MKQNGVRCAIGKCADRGAVLFGSKHKQRYVAAFLHKHKEVAKENRKATTYEVLQFI